MPPEKHALLSASSAARWLNCTAAPRFEEGLPESTSEYAEEGRLAHAIAELKTLKKFTLMSPRTYTTRLNKLKKEPLYNPEMDKTTDLYMEHLTEQAMLYDSAPTVAAEVKVDFNDYREHLKAKGPDLKIGNNIELSNFLEEQIIEHHFSPGAALVEAKTANKVVNICESTLYNYIYRGDVFLELAPEHLHEKGKRHYTKQCRKKAARAPKGESIEHRPDEILKRTTFGNWEMDSVMGAQGTTKALLVLTERLSRNGILILLPDHTSSSVVKALDKLERRYGKDFYDTFKSITVDNGCEFADYEGLERSCRRKQKRTKLYYCHPYSPHERGSNENMNRIIRRFFPKGTNFDEVQLCEVRVAEEWMNNYPRKILGWKSANQVMQEYLQTA